MTAPAPQARGNGWEPLIAAFLCNWCSYAGADLAGSSRLSYPANIRVVRVPCSGRVNPLFVLDCFKRGFDGVLVAGCHPGDCHYAKGNYYARRRLPLLREFLGYLGIEPDRVQIDWVSASESGRFAEVVQALTERVKALGPMGTRLSAWPEPCGGVLEDSAACGRVEP